MDELWNDSCPCGHDWREHTWDDGCYHGWTFDGPDPGIASEQGCMCQLAHTANSHAYRNPRENP